MSNGNSCNILVLGKTGVGKSSLLNYIFGEKLEKTGVGKSVTARGIYPHTRMLRGTKVTIYDSWGLEAGASESWKELIHENLAAHSTDKPVSEWFHAAIYCINAAGHRVETIDTEMIQLLVNEGLHVTIALTNAEDLNATDEEKLKNAIGVSLEKISITAVCSVEKELRGGSRTKAFGKDEIIEGILTNYIDSVIEKLPKRIVLVLQGIIRSNIEGLRKQDPVFSFFSPSHKLSSEEDKTKFRDDFKSAQHYFYKNTVPELIEQEIKQVGMTFQALENILEPKGEIKSETRYIDQGFWETVKDWFSGLGWDRYTIHKEDIDVTQTFEDWAKIIEKDEDKIREAMRKNIVRGA